MQTSLNFDLHAHENNHDSRSFLEENRLKFSQECEKVYNELLTGRRLTVRMNFTGHLPKRIEEINHTLERLGKPLVNKVWVRDENGKRLYKEYYL